MAKTSAPQQKQPSKGKNRLLQGELFVVTGANGKVKHCAGPGNCSPMLHNVGIGALVRIENAQPNPDLGPGSLITIIVDLQYEENNGKLAEVANTLQITDIKPHIDGNRQSNLVALHRTTMKLAQLTMMSYIELTKPLTSAKKSTTKARKRS